MIPKRLYDLLLAGLTFGVSCTPGFGQNSGGDRSILPELVGKWCLLNNVNGGEGNLSNTCITLNEDGTYDFTLDDSGRIRSGSFFPGTAISETDHGTWSASGRIITYESVAHGKGSFQFEKVNQPHNESVPMIVVGGQPFVSATPHDPW